jgi:hypothetical protein
VQGFGTLKWQNCVNGVQDKGSARTCESVGLQIDLPARVEPSECPTRHVVIHRTVHMFTAKTTYKACIHIHTYLRCMHTVYRGASTPRSDGEYFRSVKKCEDELVMRSRCKATLTSTARQPSHPPQGNPHIHRMSTRQMMHKTLIRHVCNAVGDSRFAPQKLLSQRDAAQETCT